MGNGLPNFFCDERHEGMQKPHGRFQCLHKRVPCAGSIRVFWRLQDRFNQLQIPVTVLMPDELIEGCRCTIEAIGLQLRCDDADRVGRDGSRSTGQARSDVPADGSVRGPSRYIKRESRGIPNLIGEIAVAFDPFFCQLDIASRRGHRGQGEPKGVGAELIHDVQRIDHVALGLAHLLAFCVADQGMDIDVFEGHISHELEPHHDHAGHPEEQNVEAGDQCGSRVIGLEFRRLFRPPECCERPEGGGEPGIEHVWIAEQVLAMTGGTPSWSQF